MSIQEYLNCMKDVNDNLLIFIEDEDNDENNFQQLIEKIKDKIIPEKHSNFKSLLHLILNIANNHHRGPGFFDKIFKILRYYRQDIINSFSNFEIFTIFGSNKRILLFLIEEKMMVIDECIALHFKRNKYKKAKYLQYFFPEIKEFIPLLMKKYVPNKGTKEYKFYLQDNVPEDNTWIDEMSKKLPPNFEQLRRIGENDKYLCYLIRNDVILDFVSYITKENISLDTKLEISIYETNSFLIKMGNSTLIEYALFYGSMNIYNFLKKSNAELKPSSWIYSIHSQNANAISVLQEGKISFPNESFYEVLIESIKCHHNQFAYYFIDNYQQDDDEKSREICKKSLKCYNFTFIDHKLIDQSFFFNLCSYDYYPIVDILLKNETIDVNKLYISKPLFFSNNILKKNYQMMFKKKLKFLITFHL